MAQPTNERGTSLVSTVIRAPRGAVYRACLDSEALAAWRAPDNMRAEVHTFEPREGGKFRMSLTYNDRASGAGKSSRDTDTFRGRFVELVPDQRIVEVIEFESEDPQFAGEMRMTTSFGDVPEGTEVTVLCEDIPPGIRPADNKVGTQQALQKLSALMTT